MQTAILLLGTNLGDRTQNLQQCKSSIVEKMGVLKMQSAVYETAAWGNRNQPAFYNQVLAIETLLSPFELLAQIAKIEGKMGRKRIEKWGARIIDIDILFYNNEIIDAENLKIPHPFLHLRKFTLMPLAEILPNHWHPLCEKSVQELLIEVQHSDALEVKKI